MSTKVIQICPSDVKAVWFSPSSLDHVEIDKVACLAIVEKGTSREVVYMEVMDNLIDVIDTEDPYFLGFAETDAHIRHLKELAIARFTKENKQ